jgi:hypothetical protein
MRFCEKEGIVVLLSCLILLSMFQPGKAAPLNVTGSMNGYVWYTPERFVESGIRLWLEPKLMSSADIRAGLSFGGLRDYTWSAATSSGPWTKSLGFSLADLYFYVNNDSLLADGRGRFAWNIGNNLGANWSAYTIQTDYMWTGRRFPGLSFTTFLPGSTVDGFLYWRENDRTKPLVGLQYKTPDLWNTNVKLIYVAANSYAAVETDDTFRLGARKEQDDVWSMELRRNLSGGNMTLIAANGIKSTQLSKKEGGILDFSYQRNLLDNITLDLGLFSYDKDFDPKYRSKNFYIDEDGVAVVNNPVDLYAGKTGYRIGFRGRNTVPNIDRAYIEKYEDRLTHELKKNNYIALSQSLGDYRLTLSYLDEQSQMQKDPYAFGEVQANSRTQLRIAKNFQLGKLRLVTNYDYISRYRLKPKDDFKMGRVQTHTVSTNFTLPAGAFKGANIRFSLSSYVEPDGRRWNKTKFNFRYRTLNGTDIRIGWADPSDHKRFSGEYWQGPDVMTSAGYSDTHFYIGRSVSF